MKHLYIDLVVGPLIVRGKQRLFILLGYAYRIAREYQRAVENISQLATDIVLIDKEQSLGIEIHKEDGYFGIPSPKFLQIPKRLYLIIQQPTLLNDLILPLYRLNRLHHKLIPYRLQLHQLMPLALVLPVPYLVDQDALQLAEVGLGQMVQRSGLFVSCLYYHAF